MIGQTISHYKILEKLGEGGMGVVYKAEDTKLKRTVALKFLPPDLTRDKEAKTRFIHEAQAASSLKHNHVCTIHDIDETPDGRLFICMDLYEGGSLKERIDDRPMAVAEAIKLATQVADGLSAAHDAGIVHRDIKPANILITKTGDVKIADFGLAKLSGQTKLTKTGTTVGTAGYMSPEQVQGQEAVPPSDVWSVGVMLYQMVTGKLPFTGDHDAALTYSIVNTDPVPISVHRSDVPTGAQEVIDRCLAKNPSERYRGAGDLREALLALREEIRGNVSSGDRVTSGTGPLQKRSTIVRKAALVLAVLIVAAALLYKFYQRPAAAEQAIAVMDFQDLSGGADPTLAAGITSLVNVGLIQNSPMRVVSTSYLHDLRRRLFKDREDNISRDQALEVARKSGASVALIGEVSIAGEDRLVIWQLVDTKDGRAVDGKTAQGGDVLVCAHAVVAGVLPFLNRNSSAAGSSSTSSIRTLLTDSPEAFEHYITGIKYYEQSRAVPARRQFERAIAIDSTFAAANLYLSKTHYGSLAGSTRDIDIARKCAEAAWRHRDRLDPKEMLRLEARRYWIDGRNREAWRAYEKILERWPDDLETLEEYADQLFYRWNFAKAADIVRKGCTMYPQSQRLLQLLFATALSMHESEPALHAAHMAVARFPNNPNVWDNLGQGFLAVGQLDSAIYAYEKALSIDSGFLFSMEGLAQVSYQRGEIQKAVDRMQALLSRSDLENSYRIILLSGYNSWGLVSNYAEMGQCRTALEIIEDAWQYTEGNSALQKPVGYAQCQILMRMGRFQETLNAVDAIQDSIQDRRAGEFEYFRAYALIALGELDAAHSVLQQIRSTGVISGKDNVFAIGIGAELALAEGKPEEAIDLFLEFKRSGGWGAYWQELEGRTDLARAYHAAGRSDEAIAELTELLRIFKGHALGHYELGKIYDDLGRTGEAKTEYKQFLEMWSQADEGLPQLEDARTRLAALDAGS